MPHYEPEWIAKKLIRAAKRKTRTGKVNDLIDLVFHPLFGKTGGAAEILDFIAHSINEGRLDWQKFWKYNGKSFIESLLGGGKRGRAKR